MLTLENLSPLHKKRKRIGRGGKRGGQSGKGHKGQRSRSGSRSELKPFFEGGQMSITRRLPRRGFTNIFKTQYAIVNLRDLEARFNPGEEVNVESLRTKGLVKGNKNNNKLAIKILAAGTLTKNLTVVSNAYSQAAKEAIEKAGGQIKLTEETVSGGFTT